MQRIHIAALIVMTAFYIAYFSKMLLQRRKGVQTDQIGRGRKPKGVLRTEMFMKIATYAIVPVEIVSIIWNHRMWESAFGWVGIGVAAIGVLVFILAMWTMKDSWRAGIPEKDKTELVTAGIYQVSRNPAFLGFDLMYLGLLMAFFNMVHLVFVLYAMIMLHLQILQEEQFLSEVFGEKYHLYKQTTGRYFTFQYK